MISAEYTQGYHRELAANVTICVTYTKKTWQLVYLYTSLFLFYMLPCFSLFVLYGNIVVIIKKRAKKAAGSLKSKQGQNNENANNKQHQNGGGNANNNHNHNTNNSKNHKETTSIIMNEMDKSQAKQFLEILDEEEMDEKTTGSVMALNRENSHKTSRKNSRWPSKSSSHKKASIMLPQINQKQIIRLLVIMMLSIFICLLPFKVFSLWQARASIQKLQKLGAANYYTILTISRVAFYTNSALNPIFYHIISTKFRTAFKRYFRFSFNSSLNSNHKSSKKSPTRPKDERTKDEVTLFATGGGTKK